MDLAKIKAVLEAADKETESAHHHFAEKSAVHAAAIQIMQFEKELHYGDVSPSRHLQKIREIIEAHTEEINNEITKN